MKQIYEETVKQRVKKFLQSEGIKQNWFERKIGLRFGDFTGSLNSETLRTILELYPKLNMRWLIFGEGNMNDQDPTTTIEILQKNIQALQEELDTLRKQIK